MFQDLIAILRELALVLWTGWCASEYSNIVKTRLLNKLNDEHIRFIHLWGRRERSYDLGT